MTSITLAGFCGAIGFGQPPFAVSPSSTAQQSPAVSGGVVVWQEYVKYNSLWDWDVYGVDVVNAPSVLIPVAAFEADQAHPSIWGTQVVWEDNSYNNIDTDIWVSDISDVEDVTTLSIASYENNQSFPRIHGNTVVWQHEIADPDTQILDWDIYAADITDPAVPLVYPVASFTGDQQRPDIYRSFIVWQDNGWGDNDIIAADIWRRNDPEPYSISSWTTEQNSPAADGKYVVWQEDFGNGQIDLYGADISDPANPVEFLISDAPGAQSNPALSGQLVLWQDSRNGNWDIYGYNLVTRNTFQVTSDAYNQTHPAIDGKLAAFEDDRSGTAAVYAVWLDGPNTAYCPTPIAGDANGDCRVNMLDLADLAANWLADGLMY
jgi:beta propeller repeat protein